MEFRRSWPFIALCLAGAAVSTSGQAAVPAEPVAPKPVVTPQPAVGPERNSAAGATARAGSLGSGSTLQSKTAPPTPNVAQLEAPASRSAPAASRPNALPVSSPTSTPAENSVKLVKLYRGPGHFDEALATQLRPALQKAFGTELDPQQPKPDGHPAPPAVLAAAPPKLAQQAVR